jgi:hypothetical protein
MTRNLSRAALVLLAVGIFCSASRADVYNLKVLTDASPDYSDMASLVHSTTSRWETDAEKMWALFYWVHIARRQTNPIHIHGKALTDPIMQFNDYGYAMCSTISGINCSIWQYMGYKVRYFDISLHTVPEVFYDGRWHHYDSSLSVIYTLCDGKTIAGIEDIGRTLACEASHGKAEPGHIAIYHSLNGTSPDGFLEGADTIRDLRHLGRDSFAPGVLKHRFYYNDGERGHRYILNLRDGESYIRHYARLDADRDKPDPAVFIPNGRDKDGSPRDPEAVNPRYRIRGNGVRLYTPPMSLDHLHASRNLRAGQGFLQPAEARQAAEAVFKVEGANVIASMMIDASLARAAEDQCAIAISTTNGLTWKEVWRGDGDSAAPAQLRLIDEVNGAYEVLVRVRMLAGQSPAGLRLDAIRFETITMLNSKTQPSLNLGKNTVYLAAGEQTGSIVIWPELQADRYRPYAVESHNIRTDAKHDGYRGVMHAQDGGEGYVVFRVDSPRDINRLTQGARMYVRNKGARIEFHHSLDEGRTWVRTYSFSDTTPPWDDIHHQVTADIPAGAGSVLFKYVLVNASLYSVRMEINHATAAAFSPMEVTFNWSERQADYSLVERSHTRLVESLPATYTINVGGADHPVVRSLAVGPARPAARQGYSDGRDAGGEKFIGRWVTYGKNFARGRPYTCTVPSETSWDAGDPDGRILTDGIVGSSYTGGIAYRFGALWKKGTQPVITVDLGQQRKFTAVRMHVLGYPGHDAIRGQIKDQAEVFTSADGQAFTSHGLFDFDLRWKDIPANYMWTDEETFRAHNFTKILGDTEARYVRFKLTPQRMMGVSEVQVIESIQSEPFDLRVALPEP